MRYSVRCSFLEIYNETITDLLYPSSKNLQMREDMKTGCYVQGLSEQDVLNGILLFSPAQAFVSSFFDA